MKTGKHILVTGGAGFIGAHLVERLLKDGKSVVVIDDLSTGSRDNLRAVAQHRNFRFIQTKISAYAELPELAADVRQRLGLGLFQHDPDDSSQRNSHGEPMPGQ